jgi:aspartyl-tRNA(Asn)/glutamyl-tRNA(Gln) amidotransferase subunit C
MERITSDEVRHLSVLARVGMTVDEIDLMRDQLSHILDNIDILNQVDTEGVEPTGHSVDVDSVMREDEPTPSSPVEDVMANAPDREDDHIRVRAVLE